jgi:hypothetical protein
MYTNWEHCIARDLGEFVCEDVNGFEQLNITSLEDVNGCPVV